METDFSSQYAHLSDDELLEVASDQPSLTDHAKSALNAEMSKRRLTLTDVQEHQRLVERGRRKETRRRNRKLFGSRQDRQTKIQAVVSFFWLALAMAAVTIVYLSLSSRYRLSASWEETALFVMLGSGTILVAGSSLWRKARFWLSLVISSTCHALLVHTWIVRAGSLVEKDLVYGEMAILAGPLLFAAVYGAAYQIRRRLYADAANEEGSQESKQPS